MELPDLPLAVPPLRYPARRKLGYPSTVCRELIGPVSRRSDSSPDIGWEIEITCNDLATDFEKGPNGKGELEPRARVELAICRLRIGT